MSTLGNEALSTVSHKRGLDGRRLGQLLRGELDWIVLKALEKDRTRRYESASAFAADVECYLNDAPVQACPPSAGYRLRKFIRRHRGRVAAAALALTLAVIGVAVAGGFYRQAAGERERVAKQVGQSLAGARTAVEAGDLGLAGQRVAEARAGLGVDPARLAEVAAEVDWVGKEVEARQADAARFKRFLELTTDAQDQLGYGGNLERDKAAEEALAVYAVMSDDGWLSRLDGSHLTAAQKGQVREAAYVTLVSRADFQVRWLGHRDHKDREPKEWARRGMDMLARAASFHEPTRAFYFVRAACNGFLGNTAGAEADGKLLRETPARTAWDHYLPAHTAGWQGNLDEAIRGYEAALRVQPNHYNSLYFMACRLGSDKINRRPEAIQLLTGCIALRPHHVWAYTVRAKYREQLGQLAEAEADLTAAIVAGTTDQDKLYALMERRRFYERRGDTEKAAQDVRSELTLREKIFATQDAERPEAVISLNNLARLYDITGDRTKAEPLFLQALERSRRVLGEEHHQTSIVMNNLALLYHGQGQLSKAEPLFLQALEWSRRVLGEEHGETLIVMNNLGTLYHAHGQLAKAESLLAKNLEVCRRVLGAEHPDTLMSMNNLGSLYRAQGQYAKTEPLLVKALEVSRRVRGEEHPDTLISIRNVAALYETQGQFAKAEPLFREALVKVRKRYGDGQPMVAGALAVLGLNLLQQKKFADAEPLLRECLKIRVEKEPDDWLTFNAKSMLGGSLLGQKIHAEAEPLLLTGYAGLKQREATIPAAGKLRLLEAADRLVELYDATEKKDELAKWLKVQEAVDGGGTMLGPVHEVGQGLELKGRLDKESKALIYQMRLLAGQTYVLEMVSPNPEALDPVLRVKDSSGRRLAHDDDSAGNLNARIVFRANLDGIYRIQATSYGYVGQGEFTLRVGPKE